jgi:hypothetical protein
MSLSGQRYARTLSRLMPDYFFVVKQRWRLHRARVHDPGLADLPDAEDFSNPFRRRSSQSWCAGEWNGHAPETVHAIRGG